MLQNPVLSTDFNSKKYKAFEFFKYSILALSPIISIYNGFHFINLGLMLLLGIMVIEILMQKGNFDFNVNLFIVIVFLGVLNIIIGFIHTNVISLTGYMNNSIGIFFFAAIAAYFAKNTIVDKDIFYKYIKIIALISSAFLFLQYILYSKGTILYGFIPFLNSDLIKESPTISISYGRPNSFFMEPAHYAIYVLPVYALALFKRQYITGLILLLGLFLSTSSTGIAIAILVTLFFFVRGERIPVIIRWIFALIGIIAVLQFIPYISASELLDKLSLSSLKDNIRVFGTLKYFNYFNIKELLFGVGLNQISNYLSVYAHLNVWNYSNAFIFSFLSFGLLGGILWNAYIFNLYRLGKNKILYMIFILIYFSDQLLLNRNLLYLFCILFIYSGYSDYEDSIHEGSCEDSCEDPKEG